MIGRSAGAVSGAIAAVFSGSIDLLPPWLLMIVIIIVWIGLDWIELNWIELNEMELNPIEKTPWCGPID